MTTVKYHDHEITMDYIVEPGYWTFYLRILVDGKEPALRSMTYVIPRNLKLFSWIIEDIPVHIVADSIPYILVYWGGVAIRMNVKETVNIQSVLDYIDIHLGSNHA